MKNPLNYQITEYDCGPTTVMNGISYLFAREEIPPDVLRHVMIYCLDSYNHKGEFGKSGTSSMAMMFLSHWFNQFGKAKKFPIYSEYLAGEEVEIGQNSRIISALQQGGAVVVRLTYGCWHYSLLTETKGEDIYLFDPYYRKREFTQEGIAMVHDAPYTKNRKITFEVLDRRDRSPYALGPVKTREAMILFNKETRKIPDQTIEYFI